MVSGASYKSFEQRFSLEPSPSGSRFIFEEEIKLPYGVIGKLVNLATEGMSAATVDKTEARLKELAEAQGSPT